MYTIKNSFHNTSYATRRTKEDIERLFSENPHYLSIADKALLRRIWKRLCGHQGCVCMAQYYNRQ